MDSLLSAFLSSEFNAALHCPHRVGVPMVARKMLICGGGRTNGSDRLARVDKNRWNTNRGNP